MSEEITKLVDKGGRRFVSGGAVCGMPGLTVARIKRTGNFVQVDFDKRDSKSVPPVVLHVGDVRTMS